MTLAGGPVPAIFQNPLEMELNPGTEARLQGLQAIPTGRTGTDEF
jgi:hypothetical protein